MSKCENDGDGFQIVRKKRFSKYKQTKIPSKDVQFQKQDVVIDIDKVLRRIQDAVEDLRFSTYLQDVIQSVSSILQARNIVEIICLGLGHISDCNISKYQLALLLCIKEHCNAHKVSVHDPIFYKSECEVLKKLGLEVILENNEGNYVICSEGVSVVYLPHCPKQLTNNFLWANWGLNLENCVLICNSFSSLIENQPSRILSETVPYIFKIFPHISEYVLKNNFKFTDVFNDTSIHTFPGENLGKVNSHFWMRAEKPTYENTEEFITSLMVEKLNI